MPESNTKTILIIEDEKPMASALKMKLEGEGYQVTTADDGQAGIDELKKGSFNLILLDLIMPTVDGFGVLEDMKKEGDQTPVIILSNLSQEEDKKRTAELGAKDFFVKSDTQLTTIVDKVKSLLS